MVKTVLSLLIGLLMLGSLSSCMDDPINFEEAVPLNIFRPNSMGFRFVDYVPGSPTGSVKVYWTNSSGDAQPNFGGYVARILTFDSVTTETGVKIERSTIVAQQIVPKTTQQVVFENVPVGGKYLFAVWGMRNPDPQKPDSLILSRDSAAPLKQVIFDPRPIKNPTAIRAASISRNEVMLQWDLPSTHTQGNILSYAIYYRDPSRLNDSAKVVTSIIANDTNAAGANTARFSVPAEAVGQGVPSEKEFEFWIKAVRIDSSQFYDDSTLIRWSGGERIRVGNDSARSTIHLGKALSIGKTLQQTFNAEERDQSDALAWIQFDDAGDNVMLRGVHGTKFYTVYHEESTLDIAKFTAPLSDADYSVESISVPKSSSKGWIVYAKLFGSVGEPVRLLMRASGTSIINANESLGVEMIYQPQRGSAPPLPYF